MSELGFLLKGLLIGLAIAAPVGPIGLLCIQRTLAKGRQAGLLSGLGAATADALYGAVAAFGLTLVSHALIAEHAWIQSIGGLVLIYIGFRLMRSPATNETAPGPGGRPWLLYFSVLLLTLANPMTILSFAAVFAALGLSAATHTVPAAVLTVLGVFLGSALWWLTLSTVVSLAGRTLGPSALRWIGRVAGLAIVAVGIAGFVAAGPGVL